MMEDAELLRRYVELRSEAAFTELVGRHVDLVYHAALRRTDGRVDLAKDVVQQVFTTLAGRAPKLVQHPVLTGWLYTATRYAANELLRAERRRQARETEAQMRSTLDDSAPGADWDQLRYELDVVMDELPERDRDAILLRFFRGSAFAEIGAAIGLSEDGARKRVDYALDRLRKRLVKRGITSTATALGVLLSSHAAMAAPAGLTQAIASTAFVNAGPASLSAAGIIPFMSTKLTLSLAGALGLAGMLGLSVYEVRQARQANAAVVIAQREYDVQSNQLKELHHKTHEAEQRAAALQADLDRQRAALAAQASQPPPAATLINKAQAEAMAAGQKFFAANSQARALIMDVSRAQAKANFTGFYRSAQLTPDQIDELERRTATYLLENISFTRGGVTPTATQLPDDQLLQILGDDGFQRFQDFNRAGPAYGIARQLGITAGLTASPLTVDQVELLVQAFIDSSPSYKNGQPLDMSTLDWNGALVQVQTVLTPEQWEAARPVFLAQQFQNAVKQAQKAAAAGTIKPKS